MLSYDIERISNVKSIKIVLPKYIIIIIITKNYVIISY